MFPVKTAKIVSLSISEDGFNKGLGFLILESNDLVKKPNRQEDLNKGKIRTFP